MLCLAYSCLGGQTSYAQVCGSSPEVWHDILHLNICTVLGLCISMFVITVLRTCVGGWVGACVRACVRVFCSGDGDRSAHMPLIFLANGNHQLVALKFWSSLKVYFHIAFLATSFV